ncbi:CHAP domain-containing protein [Candidatus Saccharibacteria bacterium]|nr:CHAP domain-containing protein [Candidatus Saccharibacteria bacterium]
MKQRSTTPVSASLFNKASLVAAAVLMAGSAPIALGSVAVARDYDAEIRARAQEASNYSGEAGRLGEVASTLEAALSQLRSQAESIQAAINESQTKHATLVTNIQTNEKKIVQNREALGTLLADMYVDDQISPLEMLASSNSIGDYLDKQEYRNAVQNSLSTTIAEINTLQRQLEDDKKNVEVVLEEQKSQRVLLAEKEQEQARLVEETRNDENNYRQLAETKNAEIDKLKQEQIAANLAAIRASAGSSSGGISGIPAASSGNGGYPAIWANSPINAHVDSWGMYSRQCTSYVAFKIGSKMPGWGFTGKADAKNWPARAAASGIATGSTPRVGAAAVTYGGPYGHVMYVEAVNGNTVTVSDYNLGLDGLYRYYERSAAGMTYIYF